MTRRIEDHRIDLALRLIADATGSGVGDQQKVKDALRDLFTWTPESKPKQFSPRAQSGYRKGDEDAPFFSESFLYVLLGKEDARSLLGRMRQLCEALGFNYTEQVRLYDKVEETRPLRLLICTGALRGKVVECRDYDSAREMQNPLEWATGMTSRILNPDDDWQKVLVEEDERRAKAREDRRRD